MCRLGWITTGNLSLTAAGPASSKHWTAMKTKLSFSDQSFQSVVRMHTWNASIINNKIHVESGDSFYVWCGVCADMQPWGKCSLPFFSPKIQTKCIAMQFMAWYLLPNRWKSLTNNETIKYNLHVHINKSKNLDGSYNYRFCRWKMERFCFFTRLLLRHFGLICNIVCI